MMERFKESVGFGFLLNLFLPGIGHLYWRDYLFGLFVLLVMVIAAVLFFFAFLVDLPSLVKMVLFGVPAIFYLFSFVDLARLIHRKRRPRPRSSLAAWTFVMTALIIAVLLPLTPTNFFLRNQPDFMRVDDSSMEPVLSAGDICVVNRAAYRARLFFLDQPYTHSRPSRLDLVSFVDSTSVVRLGWVIGFGGEEIALVNDSLFVDGYPLNVIPEPLPRGRLPLTRVGQGAILVATLSEGAIVNAEQVSDRDIIGKVYRLF